MTHHKSDPPSHNPFPVPRSRPVPGTMKTIHSLDRFGATRNPEIDPSDGKANVFEKNMFSKKCLFLFHTSITGRSGIFWIILLPYYQTPIRSSNLSETYSILTSHIPAGHTPTADLRSDVNKQS